MVMRKYIVLFFISLLFGFTVLILRNYYESKTGDVKSHWNVTQLEEGDAKNFFDRGLALYQGRSYIYGYENVPVVAFFRTPVYSVFLALSFLVFGVSIKTIIVLQIIMLSAMVCLISAITKLIFDNETVSRISGILTILYYPLWNDAVTLNCELIAMLLGLIALFYILKFYYAKNINLKYLLLSGFFTGLASLSRGQFFYYSFIYLIFIYGIFGITLRAKLKLAAYWFVFVLAPILVWSVYAYAISGLFIFISSQGAFAIFYGWSPIIVLQQEFPMWNSAWDRSKFEGDLHIMYIPVKSGFWFIKEAVGFIFEYPLDSLKITYYKILDSWGFMGVYLSDGIATKIMKVFKYDWNLFLAIPGLIYMRKWKEKSAFASYVFFACVAYTIVSLMTAAVIRYRLPFLDPLFIIIASYTVYKLYSRFTLKKSNLS
jgi:4-amino-4-deoxy-L-arabinose transferase-like glycosyltransferase